jgi:hypothetical protein
MKADTVLVGCLIAFFIVGWRLASLRADVKALKQQILFLLEIKADKELDHE